MLDALKKHVRFWWLYPALFILLSGMILGVGRLFMQHAQESALRSSLSGLRHIAEFKAEQVARWREVRVNIANTLVINPAVAQWLEQLVQDPGNTMLRAEILLWMQKMEGKYGHGDAAIVNTAGQEVLSIHPDLGASIQDVRKTMAEVAQTGQPQLSDLYLTTNAQPVRMMLVIPFAPVAGSGANARSFHLLIRINPYQHLFKLLQNWPVPSASGEILLLSREATDALVLNELRFWPDAALKLRLSMTNSAPCSIQTILEQSDLTEVVDYRGQRVLAAMTPIPNSPWFLVVKQDRKEVLASLVNVNRLTWWCMLAAMVVTGLLLGLLALNAWLHAVRRESIWEAEFHRLFDNMADVIFVNNPQGGIILSNRMASTTYGFSREEFQRLTTMDLIVPEEHQHIPAFMQAIQNSGQAIFETIHRRKDGSLMPVEVNARATTFQGQPALVAVIRDLTKRRQVEAEFEQQRQLLLTLINALPDLIYIKDAQHRFLLANVSTARHLDVATPADLRGRTDRDFFRTEIADKFMSDEQSVMQADRPLIAQEDQVVWPNGETKWLSTTKVPLRNHDGQVIGVVGIGHDITVRKHLNEKLEKALARSVGLELAINRSPAVVLLRRGALGSPLEYVSDNVNRWGYHAEELVGVTDVPWSHPDDRERVAAEIRQHLAGNATEFMLEYRLLTHEGDVRWIEEHIRTASDDAGALRQAQSLLVDVTAHRTLEDDLRQAQKMESIGRLAGGIAHDFNNLLQVILGFAELLAGEVADNERQFRDVHEIQTAAQRARDLTNRLLAFSRKQMLLPTRTDVNVLIQNERDALVRALSGSIELQTDLVADLWPVKVDQGQLQQVLRNLCANARDAMLRGGRVTLSTRNVVFTAEDVRLHPEARPGGFICLAIADTGVGLTDEVRAHLFEPFFTTKEPGHGAGLGLAMVYGCIKQHEGWIHTYSQAGQGTTFKMYLPALTDVGRTPPPASVVQELSGLRVLLVEDEDGVRDLASRVLRSRGCTVFLAPNVAEAEALWAQESGRFDAILCDVVLPDGNGLDLVNRWTAAGTRALIILSSGYTDERARWPLIAERGYHFLQKPYPSSELVTLLVQQARRA